MTLAEVFKNDIPLAQSTGNIQIPKFQSFLTTDPVVRAKFEIASGMFRFVKSMAPSKAARTTTLVNKTAKVLENPINSKSIKELVEELDGAINIDEQLQNLVSEATKAKAVTGDIGAPRAKLYGDGKVLSTKAKGKQQSIPLHRIASIEEVQRIADTNGINKSDRKALDQALRDQGYSAVQLGSESVRRID